MYSLNDAIIVHIADHNPNLECHYQTWLRCWNMVLWRDESAPACMAVLIFFWLAECSDSVKMLLRDSLERDSPWLDRAELFAYTAVLINDICGRNITARTAPRRAAFFYYNLMYVCTLGLYDLALRLPQLVTEKVSKQAKDTLIERWRAKQRRKGRCVDDISADGVDSDSDSDDDSDDSDDSDNDSDDNCSATY